jgi:hypothetical protein
MDNFPADAAQGAGDHNSPTPISGPGFGDKATFKLLTGHEFDRDEKVLVVGK